MKVTFYKSSDGELHETQADMQKHEEKLALKRALSTASFNGDSLDKDERENRVLYTKDIPQFILDNADLLRELLKVGAKRKYNRKPKEENKNG